MKPVCPRGFIYRQAKEMFFTPKAGLPVGAIATACPLWLMTQGFPLCVGCTTQLRLGGRVCKTLGHVPH